MSSQQKGTNQTKIVDFKDAKNGSNTSNINEDKTDFITDESVHSQLLEGAEQLKDELNIKINNNEFPYNLFSSNDILKALDANEDGDAELFKVLFRDKFCFDHASGLWYYWNEHYWKEDKLKQILSNITQVIAVYGTERNKQRWNETIAKKNGKEKEETQCKKNIGLLTERMTRLQTYKRKKNILILAQSGVKSLGVTGNNWDKRNLILPCKNGVVELETGKLKSSQPSDYIKTIAPVEWKGIAEPCDTWNRFMHEIFDWDAEMTSYMQRLLGYSISGLTTEHIYPILYGENGRNGKSTLFEILKYVLGNLTYKVPAEFMLQNQMKNSSNSPDAIMLALQGKLICWSSETGDGARFNTPKVKELSGGDTLTARAPYGRYPIEFKPTSILFLLTNRKPKASADDQAFWSRVHLIPFLLSFVKDPDPDKPFQRKADPNLAKKLKAEASGILAWLVRGFVEWQKFGLSPPEKVLSATREYRQIEDVIGGFVSDACVEGQGLQIKASELYKGYKDWCVQNGHRSVSSTRFGTDMKKRYEVKKSNGIHYLDIDLLDESYL